MLAKQALSQLSYNPIYMVGLNGLEPSTSRLSGVRSNHLSYKPILPVTWLFYYKKIKIASFLIKIFKNGVQLGIRTLDPLIKSQLLYQLS